jgi:glycosyltransferase involved in cell wall biosynthesis
MSTVSVVIPVFNGTNYLGEAVDSVLAQTYRDYEILVIDDGSTDASWDLIQSYGDRVRGIRKPNGGCASALNVGLAEMRGKWFAWLSHDDLWLPRKLERQVGFLKQHPEFKACYTDYFVIDAVGQRLRQVETPWYPRAKAARTLFGSMYMGGSTMLIERQCFDRVGRFSEVLRTTPDVDMWLRLLAHFEIGRVADPLAMERTHAAQDSRTKSVFMEEEKQATFERLFLDLGADLFADLGFTGSERKLNAHAHNWFADTMANDRLYDDLATRHYARAIALDPAWNNPARVKRIRVKARKWLRAAYHGVRRFT